MGDGPTIPTEQYFDKGLWGWDGSQWRKANVFLNFYDRYTERVTFTVTVAGTNILVTTAVPVGYVRVLQSVFARNNTRITSIEIWLRTGAVYACPIVMAPNTAAGFGVGEVGAWAMKEGDLVCAVFLGCQVGDTLELTIWGYRTQVA
jgi:hypothetical protein